MIFLFLSCYRTRVSDCPSVTKDTLFCDIAGWGRREDGEPSRQVVCHRNEELGHCAEATTASRRTDDGRVRIASLPLYIASLPIYGTIYRLPKYTM